MADTKLRGQCRDAPVRSTEKSKKIARLTRGELTTVKAALKPDTFSKVMEDTFPCQQAIDLEPGTYYLRLGVRNSRSGLIGTTNAKVAGASAASAPAKP